MARTTEVERAIPCHCGRGEAAEITQDGAVTIIDCDACQDEKEAARPDTAEYRRFAAAFGI